MRAWSIGSYLAMSRAIVLLIPPTTNCKDQDHLAFHIDTTAHQRTLYTNFSTQGTLPYCMSESLNHAEKVPRIFPLDKGGVGSGRVRESSF